MEKSSIAVVQLNRIASEGPSTGLEKEDVTNPPDASTIDPADISKMNTIPTPFNISSFRGPPTPLEICMPVIACEEMHPEVEEKEKAVAENRIVDFQSPDTVASRVKIYIQRWGRVVPVHPVQFLHNILTKRGYDYHFIHTVNEKKRYPSEKQVKDYDNELVGAIRTSDLNKLRKLHQQGKSMSACNRFSESIVHMACRRASKEVVEFLLEHGADIELVDDFGRTPLHDACWRPEPQFDVVTMICDRNLDLLRYSDLRGSIPLNYVREEHWVQWCAYLFNQIEKYWVLRPESFSNNKKRKFEENKEINGHTDSSDDSNSVKVTNPLNIVESGSD